MGHFSGVAGVATWGEILACEILGVYMYELQSVLMHVTAQGSPTGS